MLETTVSSKDLPELLDMKYRSEFKHVFTNPEAVTQRCLVKKVFIEILQNSQENKSHFFNAVAGLKKRLVQVLSCEFYKISKNTFFYRIHLW